MSYAGPIRVSIHGLRKVFFEEDESPGQAR
jgi:hypothetical protein